MKDSFLDRNDCIIELERYEFMNDDGIVGGL